MAFRELVNALRRTTKAAKWRLLWFLSVRALRQKDLEQILEEFCTFFCRSRVFALSLGNAIHELNEDIGIPENLTTAIRQAAKGREVSDEEIESRIDAMADDAMKSGNIAVNPRSSQKRDIVELYHKAI